ncbi:hypothetical protein FQN55_004677 [Onygenales sp. PD_40]|nr:hypothetical protein FQN55_004677 [Onygenales sp. PD_40]KAK2771768.1 hypothetical protein FQN53_004902 [Emmonsiellopsis sp. PD_33]KAK2776452.1 hypothetical protein FQN52_003461 [Onygenales sp. PD_12]KAK2806558.1 hypothetical protein FQN51_006524 [Onygenales sp. PD_10]
MTPQEPLTIAVIGRSTIIKPPERAVIRVSIETASNDQTEASTTATKTAHLIQSKLNEHTTTNTAYTQRANEITSDSAITHWSMSSISTHSYTPDDSPIPTHEARASFSIKFRDFDTLALLSAELAVIPYVNVGAVEWMLTDATVSSLAAENRVNAARNARERALDYARAFGYESVVPVEVKDSASGLPYTRTASTMRKKQAMAEQLRRAKLAFYPEEIEMTSTVDVKFQAG